MEPDTCVAEVTKLRPSVVVARPPTPVGTWGEIGAKQISEDRWEAWGRIRIADGRSKLVRAHGKSETKAKNALRTKFKAMADEITSGEISKETRFGRIADLWLEDFTRGYKLEEKPGTTPRLYGSYVRNWVKPRLGELRAVEVRAKQCDDLIQKGREKSYETAKSIRAVLTGICTYAVRQGAMEVNPVRSTGRLSQGKKREVKALTAPQRRDLLGKLEAHAEAKKVDSKGRRNVRSKVWQDLPDIMRAMLATGVRLGELLAVDGPDVDQRTVRIAHHIVREPGRGLVRVEGRKGGEPPLLLGVPEWSVPMWRARKLASGGGPLFASWNGQRLDPSNTINRIREAMTEVGYDWVTSHVWRKTVATVLDEAGLQTTAIADQLGNTPAMVDKHYRAVRQTNQAAVAALESILDEE